MSEKKGEFDLTPWVLLGGGIAGGCLLGYFIFPEIQKIFAAKPQEPSNPKPEPEKEQVPEESSPELWIPSPHFTRNVNPQLSARFSHSSVTQDRQSMDQQMQEQQALERMDLFKRQQQQRWKPKQIGLAVPQDKRLTYGSDGHGSIVSVNRPQKSKWRLKR